MKKCKDCKLFKNGCDFSTGDFVACGQFVPTVIVRDCLSCSNSFSEPCENGDVLHCMKKMKML